MTYKVPSKNELMELLKEHGSAYKIAKHLNINDNTVYLWYKKRNISLTWNKRVSDDDFKSLYEDNSNSISSLAELWGVSEVSIRRRACQSNIKRKRGVTVSRKVTDEEFAHLRSTMPLKFLAGYLNTDSSNIYKRSKKLNLPKPDLMDIRKIPLPTREELIEETLQHPDKHYLADLYGVHIGTLYRWYKELGLSYRELKKESKEKFKWVS